MISSNSRGEGLFLFSMTVVHIIEAFWGAVLLAEDQESLSWASDGFPGQVMYQSDGFREETTRHSWTWSFRAQI